MFPHKEFTTMIRLSVIASISFFVAALINPARADLLVFTDQAQFEAAMQASGKNTFLGIEDFEEAIVGNGPFGAVTLPDVPLQPGVPNLAGNGRGFENGLEGLDVIQIYGTKRFGSSIFDPPADPDILVVGQNYQGPNFTSKMLTASDPRAQTVIETLEEGIVGIGFDYYAPQVDLFEFAIFDRAGQVITSGADIPTGSVGFFGVMANNGTAIGRIQVGNFTGLFPNDGYDREFIDNIQAWSGIPEPSSTIFVMTAILGMLNRRRSIQE